ncbi:uncharacterized protein LOC127263618 [Andrographis paniculata]|uniref:uncharacterized protein LOC127263618 n=1 Tax=Andrographis paniculata TaxID=175694 RepID=UPI0021E7975F|nr:uncharacterized protein LOC127263618 [Andrographis paniculata]XP_051148686.1 uncharacterized protein LOC127263618 [Andrographis paniculata]
MEIDSQVSIQSKCGEYMIEDCGEAEFCAKELGTELFNVEIRPCAESNVGDSMEGLEASTSMQPMDNDTDGKGVAHIADIWTEEVANGGALHSLVENPVKDATGELDLCSEVQVKEIGNSSKLQPQTYAEQVFVNEKVEPLSKSLNNGVGEDPCVNILVEKALNDAEVKEKEVIGDSEIKPCVESHALEPMEVSNLGPFTIGKDIKEEKVDASEPCPKHEVREASNDDIYSEVSNPNLPPKHVSSSMTISSQPPDVHGSDQGCCGEVTSACYRSLFADEEVHKKCTAESVSTACVVLEIPKHVRPTGIRKITFKFRKRKEDYDCALSVAVKPLSSEINLSADGIDLHGTQSLSMASKAMPDYYPANVKKLLSTGILEGARVTYISLSGEKEIPGIVKGCSYLCGCSLCNFSKIVSAHDFELHAGTKTRHPNNHVYLENGKPICSIIEKMRTATPSTWDSVIRAVAGSSVHEENLQAWKANLPYGNDGAFLDGSSQSKCFGMFDCSTRYPSNHSEDSSSPPSSLCSHPNPSHQGSYLKVPAEQKRPAKKQKASLSSSFLGHKKAAAGGNKKRDNDLHKVLFMPNGLPDGTSLAYYSKGKRILGGYKQGNGIVCSCCNTEVSPSQFEAHAGWAVKRQPYRHIYTSSGYSLHDVALMLANGQTLDSIGSDDMCAFCGDGGELKLCTGCPRAFHAACLDEEYTAADDWICPYCKEKTGSDGKASGKSRSIILRLKKDGKTPQFVAGGCIICRSQDFSPAKFGDRTVIICDQCEKEYHVGCLRESGMCDLKELPGDKWFCCVECYKIFEILQNKSSSAPEAIPSSASAILYKRNPTMGLNGESKNEIEWCVVNGKKRFMGHLKLLSRAAQIFRECFDPIIASSGRDLIPVMVYGRNISGQEFSGMYTVVLIVRSIVVSAALLRIFGQEIAEIPLVATGRNYQGNGYFRVLFSCIEWFLSSLGVKHLALPAAEEAESMWMNKLGFAKMSHEQMLKYTRDYQLTMFKGTNLLGREVHTIEEQ